MYYVSTKYCGWAQSLAENVPTIHEPLQLDSCTHSLQKYQQMKETLKIIYLQDRCLDAGLCVQHYGGGGRSTNANYIVSLRSAKLPKTI